MPVVTMQTRGHSNGEIVTEFVDSVGPDLTTWTYPSNQHYIKFTNDGISNITINAGSYTNRVIEPGQSLEGVTNFKEISMQSVSGTQQFLVRTSKIKRNQEGYNFMHNRDIGLRRWQAAKAKALAGIAKYNVTFIADSIGEGTGSSEHYTKGLGGLLRSHFTSEPFNDTGTGFIPIHHSTSSSTPLVTLTGAWQDCGVYGVCKRAKRTSTVGDTATFKFTGTSFDIWYVRRSGGGSFSIVVDGGTPKNIFTEGATATIKYYTGGLTAGEHTVTITHAGGVAGMVTIVGYCPYVGATYGMQFNTMAKFGSILSDHVDDNVIGFEVDTYTPILSIIALMANDSGTQVSIANYQSRMQKLIDRCKKHGDVLLVSTGLRNINYEIPQKEYNNALRDLAYDNDAAFLDIFNAWGGDYVWQQGKLGLIVGAGDGVHPNDGGHKEIANRIIQMLS